MGQYYDILLKRDKFEHYDRSIDGRYVMAKLTEHSWWKNETCAAICRLITPVPAKVYWIGDYADGADPVNGMTEAETKSVFRKCYGKRALKDRTLSGANPQFLDRMFLVNYTKAEYIDCSEFYKKSLNKSGWAMHPLPLLTAIGNGLGGGGLSRSKRRPHRNMGWRPHRSFEHRTGELREERSVFQGGVLR